MSFWHWHTAHVQSKSRAEIIEGIQIVMSKITKGMLMPVEDHFASKYFLSVGDINLLFVSPQQENWTTFWGSDHAFSTRVFETCSYSGLLVAGIDHQIPKQYGQRESWSYIIWKKGVIIDWFVSNLSVYFDMELWSEQSITRVVQPYLRRLRFDISDLTEDWSLLSTLENKYVQAFKGNLLELRNYTRPEISDETVKNWLELPTRQALSKSPEVLNIPFSGSAYEMDDIAIYHDVKRGLVSPRPEDQNQDTFYQDAYNRSLRLPRIEEFKPVLFNKVTPSETVVLPFEGFWF